MELKALILLSSSAPDGEPRPLTFEFFSWTRKMMKLAYKALMPMAMTNPRLWPVLNATAGWETTRPKTASSNKRSMLFSAYQFNKAYKQNTHQYKRRQRYMYITLVQTCHWSIIANVILMKRKGESVHSNLA